MQVPAHGRLWTNRTICGIPIPESAEGVYGYFVRSVSICHGRLVGYAVAPVTPPTDEEKASDPWAHHNYMARSDDAERYICEVAQRLIEERDNPAHYGDNLPGWFDVNHKPITPARFSFSDLIGYGPNPDTGGVKGFLALCKARSYEDLEIAAGLLSLDEAMQFASTDLAYGFHLLGEAQALEDYLRLAKVRRELEGRLPEEVIATMFPELEALKEKHQRIAEGARKGGQKAAEARRRSPPVVRFTDGELLAEERRLLAAGREQHEVAGIIAGNLGAPADSVRKRLRKARKSVPKGLESRD